MVCDQSNTFTNMVCCMQTSPEQQPIASVVLDQTFSKAGLDPNQDESENEGVHCEVGKMLAKKLCRSSEAI